MSPMRRIAFRVEFRFESLLSVHALLWPVVTMPPAVILMRPAKAMMVQQYRHRSAEMGL